MYPLLAIRRRSFEWFRGRIVERGGSKECQLTFDIPIASSSRTADAEAEHKGFKSAHSDTPRASNAKANSSNFCVEARDEDLGGGEGGGA